MATDVPGAPPDFESERLTFRRWRPTDEPAAFRLYGDAAVFEFLGDGNVEPSSHPIHSWIRLQLMSAQCSSVTGGGLWAIVERGSGEVIGSVMLMPDGRGDLELAYHLAREFWNRGYGSEAAAAMVHYGFSRVGLTRLVAYAYPANTASIRILEKVGFVADGTRPYADKELCYFVLTAAALPAS